MTKDIANILDWGSGGTETNRPYNVMHMPGKVVSMSVSGEHLFALCAITNPWWKFWRKKHETRLVMLEGPTLRSHLKESSNG